MIPMLPMPMLPMCLSTIPPFVMAKPARCDTWHRKRWVGRSGYCDRVVDDEAAILIIIIIIIIAIAIIILITILLLVALRHLGVMFTVLRFCCGN